VSSVEHVNTERMENMWSYLVNQIKTLHSI